MSFTDDQKHPLTPFPGNDPPEYVSSDLSDTEPTQDQTADFDRIGAPTPPKVGEADQSSSNTNPSWEQVPEAMSDDSARFSMKTGEEDASDHPDEGERAQGHARQTRAKVASRGEPHSAQVMSPNTQSSAQHDHDGLQQPTGSWAQVTHPKLSEIRKLFAECYKTWTWEHMLKNEFFPWKVIRTHY